MIHGRTIQYHESQTDLDLKRLGLFLLLKENFINRFVKQEAHLVSFVHLSLHIMHLVYMCVDISHILR